MCKLITIKCDESEARGARGVGPLIGRAVRDARAREGGRARRTALLYERGPPHLSLSRTTGNIKMYVKLAIDKRNKSCRIAARRPRPRPRPPPSLARAHIFLRSSYFTGFFRRLSRPLYAYSAARRRSGTRRRCGLKDSRCRESTVSLLHHRGAIFSYDLFNSSPKAPRARSAHAGGRCRTPPLRDDYVSTTGNLMYPRRHGAGRYRRASAGSGGRVGGRGLSTFSQLRTELSLNLADLTFPSKASLVTARTFLAFREVRTGWGDSRLPETKKERHASEKYLELV
ncbi:hypothetical protein EVAR_98995_1 [Eumeta japonica]|uniref:Uncharacterized protein n=1 Tax=Eumeta variegata TaxID=151549 RepID=A0A4C1YRJ7_EUMVA|nr:hypothetical protein EVAR_98995_1 [Eumeta japonica]